VAMEDVTALLDSQSNGVGCAPFIEGAGVKETDESVPAASFNLHQSGRDQDVIEGSCRQFLRIVGGLGRGRDQAADFARPSTDIGRTWTPAKVLVNGFRFDRSVVLIVPARVGVEMLVALLGYRRG